MEPLIITLQVDDRSFTSLNALRRQHFPPERNLIPAHITLFHRLPGEHLREIACHLERVCRARQPFTVTATGIRLLGRGVAFDLTSPELVALRNTLARDWQTWLSRQDQQTYRPHVTIQNKVFPEEARALQTRLSRDFTPFGIEALGLHLWRYKGGPWEALDAIPFGTVEVHIAGE